MEILGKCNHANQEDTDFGFPCGQPLDAFQRIVDSNEAIHGETDDDPVGNVPQEVDNEKHPCAKANESKYDLLISCISGAQRQFVVELI